MTLPLKGDVLTASCFVLSKKQNFRQPFVLDNPPMSRACPEIPNTTLQWVYIRAFSLVLAWPGWVTLFSV